MRNHPGKVQKIRLHTSISALGLVGVGKMASLIKEVCPIKGKEFDEQMQNASSFLNQYSKMIELY